MSCLLLTPQSCSPTRAPSSSTATFHGALCQGEKRAGNDNAAVNNRVPRVSGSYTRQYIMSTATGRLQSFLGGPHSLEVSDGNTERATKIFLSQLLGAGEDPPMRCWGGWGVVWEVLFSVGPWWLYRGSSLGGVVLCPSQGRQKRSCPRPEPHCTVGLTALGEDIDLIPVSPHGAGHERARVRAPGAGNTEREGIQTLAVCRAP